MSDYYMWDRATGVTPMDDPHAWAQWFKTADRRVAHDTLTSPRGVQVQVSTVFLGLDHSYGFGSGPMLFETMVFGGMLDGEMYRYAKVDGPEGAFQGHARMLERVRESFREASYEREAL